MIGPLQEVYCDGVHITEALDSIIFEAKLVKTALSSCLPVSWSAEANLGPEESLDLSTGTWEDSNMEKADPVSAAGFEMVELLLLAAQLQKEMIIQRNSAVGVS